MRLLGEATTVEFQRVPSWYQDAAIVVSSQHMATAADNSYCDSYKKLILLQGVQPMVS